MRTVKFRAWYHNGTDKTVGTMQHGVAVKNNEAEVLDTDGTKKWSNCVELMQFTGLYDRLGREIYEGDIVKIMYHYDSYGKNEFEEYRNYKVTWWEDQGSWMMEGAKETFSGAAESEVIGNMFENPELLKGDHD